MHFDPVLFERIAGGAPEFGDGLVEFGLRAQFVAARCGERGLAFEHEEEGRLSSVELALLAGVLLLGGGTRRGRCAQT